MASISQGIVFTTAMVLSSTVLYLAFSRQKAIPPFKIHGDSDSRESNKQILRSCLYSEEKKRERKMSKKKKKRVQFAENVKEEGIETSNDNPGIPANRMALYNGILRDRVHRMECSY